MSDIEKILSTEYSNEFDKLRKNRMATSFYKYGPIEENYKNKLVSALRQLEERIALYWETGNTEFLVDAANFAMIEFMYPSHPKAHFDSEHGVRINGMTFNDLKQL